MQPHTIVSGDALGLSADLDEILSPSQGKRRKTAAEAVYETLQADATHGVQIEAVCPGCCRHDVIDESERCQCCCGWICSDCDPRGDDDNPAAYSCPGCRGDDFEEGI